MKNKYEVYKKVMLFVVAWMVALSIACTTESDADSQPESTTTVEEQPIEPISADTIHKYYAAISRIGGGIVDQTCFDSQTNLWFVHSAAKHRDWNGWYYEDHNSIEVLELGNSTIAVTNADDIFNTYIRPSVTGLNCKSYVPDLTDDVDTNNTTCEHSSSEETT